MECFTLTCKMVEWWIWASRISSDVSWPAAAPSFRPISHTLTHSHTHTANIGKISIRYFSKSGQKVARRRIASEKGHLSLPPRLPKEREKREKKAANILTGFELHCTAFGNEEVAEKGNTHTHTHTHTQWERERERKQKVWKTVQKEEALNTVQNEQSSSTEQQQLQQQQLAAARSPAKTRAAAETNAAPANNASASPIRWTAEPLPTRICWTEAEPHPSRRLRCPLAAERPMPLFFFKRILTIPESLHC